jgi:hypothetical protein
VPGVNLAHQTGIWRIARGQGGADITHECDGRAGRSPDPQHHGIGVVRVAEAVPLPASSDEHGPGGCLLRLIISGYQQTAMQDIDRLIESVVGVRDGPGEMSRDGDLHGREARRPILMTGKDVHRLPRVPEGRPFTAMSQERHEPFIRPSRATYRN